MGTDDPNQTTESTASDPSGESDESIVDLAQQPIVMDSTKFVAALFALVGIGLGLAMILFDVVDQEIISDVSMTGTEYSELLAITLFYVVPYFAVLGAVVVGVLFGWQLERDDKTTFLAAGLGSFVGTIAIWLLASIVASIPIDITIDFGGLLVAAIAAGVAAGIVAAGGVWIVRNLAPDGVEDVTRTADRTVHTTDD